MTWLAGGNNYAPPKIAFVVRADEIISAWLLDCAVWRKTTSSNLIFSFPLLSRPTAKVFWKVFPPLCPSVSATPSLFTHHAYAHCKSFFFFFASCFFSVPSLPAAPLPHPRWKWLLVYFYPLLLSSLSTFHPFPSFQPLPPSWFQFSSVLLNVCSKCLALWMILSRLDVMFKIRLVLWLIETQSRPCVLFFFVPYF